MELFKILGTIALGGMDQFNADMDSAAGKGSTLASKLSSGLQTVAKVGGAAITAASTAVATLTKSAIDNYAEYEQLTGGVETLFKDSADTVMGYAANAYQTAGLSANEYMSTVTSFSAALLQGLGGDTATAANMANLAITDMSDNANKMGSDMAAIQNAYQGFAKQNYTMLDNLKLGYGGTASEMARLINDSGVLGKTMKVTADNVNNVSFDKIIEAIHVIQTNMGITGTTALEASTTISGSLASMKAAWSNLSVGIADDTQNMTTLVSNFVNSVATVAENLLPRITIALNGISQLITQLAPIFSSAVPQLIATVLPSMIDAGVQLVNALLQGITQNAGTITSGAISVASQLVTGIVSFIPNIITAGNTLIMSLNTGIADALPGIVSAVTGIIPEIVNAISSGAPLVLGSAIILLNAIAEAIPQVAATLSSAIPQLVTGVISAIASATPQLLAAGIALFMALVDAIPEVVTALAGALPQIISTIVSTLVSNAPAILEASVQVFLAIVEAIPQILDSLVEALGSLMQSGIDAIRPYVESFLQAGKDVINGLLEGLKAAWTNVTQWISNAFNGLVDGVKSLLGIHSPSIVFEGIGKDIVSGLEKGWTEEFDNFLKVAEEGTSALIDLYKQMPEEMEQSINSAMAATYDPNIDYAAKMQETTDAQEFLMLAAQRNAKIAGENIDLVAEGYADNATLLAQWAETAGGEITNVAESVKETMSTATTETTSAVTEMVTNVVSELGAMASEAEAIGGQFVDGLISGIMSKSSDLYETVRNLAAEAAQAVRDEMQIASPSKVFRAIGEFMAAGLGIGFEDEYENAERKIVNNVSRLKSTSFEDATNRVKSLNPSMLFESASDFGVTRSGNNNLIAELFERLLSAINGLGENMGDSMKKALDGTSLSVNKREFGRLVKAVN